jgi:two-component system response regulator YesN
MKKIMVVDDEFIVRVGIRSIVNWEEHGYTMVAEAANGAEALEKIALHHPDIVLTDLVMDNMDGFELIRACSEKFPEIAFVVLSSYNDFENVRQAMKLGARDYIFKLKAGPEEILKVLDEISGEEPAGGGSEPVRRDLLDGVIRENLPAIKRNLLRKCVDRSFQSEEETLSRFKALSLHIDLLKPFCLLYISIDNFVQLKVSGEIKDVQLIKSSMENIIYEALGKKWEAEVFDYDKGDIAVFINCLYDEDGLREDFSKIQDYIKRYLGIEVSGTISPVMKGIVELPEFFRVCGDTLRQRTGNARLLPYNEGQRNEIARAKEYILKNLEEKLGVQEAAAHVGMSESYFSHLFKKETGINFIDYVNRAKMEVAAELLADPGLKMLDIASRIGIDNPNYFSVLFKKTMGVSPQEYRSKNTGS